MIQSKITASRRGTSDFLQFRLLPRAEAKWRGRIVILQGASGTEDMFCTCRKNLSDTYDWVEVVFEPII